jgi:hypothetical protein
MLTSAVVLVAQDKAWYVNAAQQLAQQFNIGIKRDSIKQHLDVINLELQKGEDFSLDTFDIHAAHQELIARYPNAATPFTSEKLETTWPAYRGTIAMNKKVHVHNLRQGLLHTLIVR